MYLNNIKFRFSFIGDINIITHAIFMKIRIVHMLIGYRVSVLRHIECTDMSVLGTYMTSRYMLITQ